MARDLVADANRNLLHAFNISIEEYPAGSCRQFGSVSALVTDIDQPFFNRIFVLQPSRREDLLKAIRWIETVGVPYWVMVAEDALGPLEDAMGPFDLSHVETQPGMARSSLEDIPSDSSSVTIQPATTQDELEQGIEVFVPVFDIPREITSRLFSASLLGRDDFELLLGRVNGEAVACGQLVISDDIAGVYSIGVLEGFRRQGIGEAVTWAVLAAGREAGCRVGILQSTDMGYSLYQRMGFETVVEYHIYEAAS